MMVLLQVYLGVMVAMIGLGGFIFIEATFKQKKLASRMILLAPVWPLLAPVFFFKGVRWLWKKADWRGIEEDEYEERLKAQRGRW